MEKKTTVQKKKDTEDEKNNKTQGTKKEFGFTEIPSNEDVY
jgi:hypothetical protein